MASQSASRHQIEHGRHASLPSRSPSHRLETVLVFTMEARKPPPPPSPPQSPEKPHPWTVESAHGVLYSSGHAGCADPESAIRLSVTSDTAQPTAHEVHIHIPSRLYTNSALTTAILPSTLPLNSTLGPIVSATLTAASAAPASLLPPGQ